PGIGSTSESVRGLGPDTGRARFYHRRRVNGDAVECAASFRSLRSRLSRCRGRGRRAARGRRGGARTCADEGDEPRPGVQQQKESPRALEQIERHGFHTYSLLNAWCDGLPKSRAVKVSPAAYGAGITLRSTLAELGPRAGHEEW